MQSWRTGPSRPQFCSRHLSRDPQNNDCSADPLTPWRSPGFSFGGPLSPRPRRNASVSIRHPRRKSGQERAHRPRPHSLGGQIPWGGQPQVVTRMMAWMPSPRSLTPWPAAAGFASKEHTSRSVGQTKMKRRQAERPSNGFDNTPANRRDDNLGAAKVT